MTACGATQAAAEIAARTIDANRKHAHLLTARPATGTRRAGTFHLHQVGQQAQMTQLKYYPKTQIGQGADRISATAASLLSARQRFGTGPRHARTGCETPPTSNGSRRAVSPNTCLLALGRCEGFDVARLCHFVRKLCPALAEQQVCDIGVPNPANSLWRDHDMLEPADD